MWLGWFDVRGLGAVLDHKKPLPPGNRSTGPDPRPDQGRTQLSQGKERSRLPRLLFENPLHHAGADAERSADLENAVSVGSQLQYARLDRGLNPTPAQLRTFRPSASKTRVYSFANDPTLELGKHAKHLKHRFARSRRSIESLLVEEQTDALVMKALEYAEQVGERSSEPIH